MAPGCLTVCSCNATGTVTAVLSGGDDEPTISNILIHVPLFLLWSWLIALAMKRESTRVAALLMPYVAQGGIVPSEIQMVCFAHVPSLAWASNAVGRWRRRQ